MIVMIVHEPLPSTYIYGEATPPNMEHNNEGLVQMIFLFNCLGCLRFQPLILKFGVCWGGHSFRQKMPSDHHAIDQGLQKNV